jgi:protein gp37
MHKTAIKWTEQTWNPVTGCKEVSPGCAFCYAREIANGNRYGDNSRFPNGFGLTLRPDRLIEPMMLKNPTVIFVNSMSDLFWEEIPEWYVMAILRVIELCPRHVFQVLTKRPERMLYFSLKSPFPDNLWAGVTIESQAQARRLDVLKKVEAKTKFISAEPLLSPLDLDWDAVNWVITGGESGSHLKDPRICAKRGLAEWNGRAWVPRQDRIDWVKGIRDSCVAVGTHFFHKQWGGPYSGSAGRELDGREWDEHPPY